MKYATIENGVVTGFFKNPQSFSTVESPDDIDLGWTFDGKDWAAPAAPKVTSITRLQRNLWLGKERYEMLTAWIDSLPEESGFQASIYWRDAETTRRDHPLTIAMGQVLGLTPEQMDEAFVQASKA